MNYAHCLWVVVVFFITLPAFGASYSISTNSAGENVLDEAQATTHPGQTHLQILQKSVNVFLQGLFAQQNASASREINDKLEVATNAAKNNARTALNAGISLPVVTDITNQTNNVAQSPVIPIIATDPDSLPLRITATNLPPGMIVSSAVDGTPQITGTLTTAGTYSVVIHAFKFSDVQGTDSFTWVVNP